MRYWALILIPMLCGFVPYTDKHQDLAQVDEEFKTLYYNVQPRQFVVQTSTPNYNFLREGEAVLVSSGSIAPTLIFRVNNSTWSIQLQKR